MKISKTLRSLALALLAGVIALTGSAFAQSSVEDFTPITDEYLANPSDSDWPMYRRTYDLWGYSPLDQINKENVDQLQLVWARAMEPGSNEGTPLVYNGVMYIANPNDVIQAIDAVTGDLIWEYRRQLPSPDQMNMLGEHTRSIALYDDKVYHVSFDNYVIALDARTGALVWESDRGDNQYVTNSTGPIVAAGKVIAGSTCQFAPFGCYVTAHDAESGEELWRNYFIPREGEEGDETWNGLPFESRWMTGAWGSLAYDPELNMVYYGSTGVGPASETVRGSGDGSLYGTNTRFGVDVDTGEIVWRHQVHPRDNWDQECTFDMMLVDTVVSPTADDLWAVNPNVELGEERKVTVGIPCKTGVTWAFDRENGEFLWAKSTVEINMYDDIDETGTPIINEDVILREVGESVFVCPTFTGGKDWAPAAYSPLTNAFYVPLNDACADMLPFTDEPTPDDVYAVAETYHMAPGKDTVGRMDAINVETGETLWSHQRRSPNYSPVMTTGGGLVFGGGADRYFRAFDQETGEVIWQTRLASAVSGHSVSYEVDGKQYVAVLAGSALAGADFAALVPEIDFVTGANAVYVFALPDDVQ